MVANNDKHFVVDSVRRTSSVFCFKIIIDNGMLAPDGVLACDNTIFRFQAILLNTNDGRSLDDFNKLVAQDQECAV